jgi:hypothetical protein
VRGDSIQEREISSAGSFPLLVRAVPAIIAAAVSASEMIRCSEDHQSVGIKIIISGDDG